MKKSLALSFIIIFVAFFFSVELKPQPNYYVPIVSPYLEISIFEYNKEGVFPNGEYIYGQLTEKEKIPVLEVGKEYCLSVDLFPGSTYASYAYTTILFNEEELELIEESERQPGGCYLLRAKKECKNSLIHVFYQTSIQNPQQKIERSIYVNFSSEVDN